jgi:hypothetical protein
VFLSLWRSRRAGASPLTSMPVLNVTRHASFADAIEATGFDCSYNPWEVRKYIDGFAKDKEGKVEAIFSTSTGRILYVWDSPQWGRLLNEFSPFSGGIDSRPLCVGMIDSHENQIVIFSTIKVSKSDLKRRRQLREQGFLLTNQERWFTC